jgi:hypothetical protein
MHNNQSSDIWLTFTADASNIATSLKTILRNALQPYMDLPLSRNLLPWYFVICYEGKVTIVSVHNMEACRPVEAQFHSLLTSALDRSEWLPSCSDRFTFDERSPDIHWTGRSSGRDQNQSGRFGFQKNLFLVPEIEPRILQSIVWPLYQPTYLGSFITLCLHHFYKLSDSRVYGLIFLSLYRKAKKGKVVLLHAFKV